MTTRNYSANAVQTTLSASCTSTATSIAVTATTGFPAAPFILALDAGAASQEVVLVTAVAGLTLTVERGYDSTAAVSHTTGAVVQHVHSAIDFRDSRTHENSTSGIHGLDPGSALVGTNDAQALTNKNLSDPSNTFPGTLATDTEVVAAIDAKVPVGALTAFAGSVNPSGWMSCDGQAVSRTTYDALFTAIGTTYGAGDGVTTFNLPDLRGAFPMHKSGSHALGSEGGSETVTLVEANLPVHDHQMTHYHSMDHNHPSFTTSSDGAHSHTTHVGWETDAPNTGAGARFTNVGDLPANQGSNKGNAPTTSAGAHTHTVDVPNFVGDTGGSSQIRTGTTGSGTAATVLNPFVALNWIIRVS